MMKGSVILVLIAVGLISSCKKSEDVKLPDGIPEVEVFDKTQKYPYERLATVHLSRDTVYKISNLFERQAGEQLIIDDGTIIKMISSGANVGSIAIRAGGIILASGTADRPIVFTSNANPSTQQANWNGITLEGKSYNNATGPDGDPADFSGVLKYVRIEFGGLTLTSVGNLTTIENVQVSYTSTQSSFAIQGGTFNARNLVSYACGGAADFYITSGYTGKMQNLLAYRHPFFGAPASTPANALCGLFIENNANDTTAKPYTNPIISNMTVMGPDAQNGSTAGYGDTTTASLRSAALLTSGNALFQLRNSLFFSFPAGGFYLDDPSTGKNIIGNGSSFTHSIVQSNDSDRSFYIKPGSIPPYTSEDFKSFMLGDGFQNKLFYHSSDFLITDPFNYNSPNLLPLPNSPVMTGADFSGTDFRDAFFNPVSWLGAFGTENWMSGWTNFTPLKTNYNFPQ